MSVLKVNIPYLFSKHIIFLFFNFFNKLIFLYIDFGKGQVLVFTNLILLNFFFNTDSIFFSLDKEMIGNKIFPFLFKKNPALLRNLITFFVPSIPALFVQF